MEWGIPTLIETPDPEGASALCRELGFDFVELNMNLPEYQSWDIPRLRKVGEKYGVYFSIHLDENLNVCDFNRRVADAYLETLLETIDVARRLNVPVINMHLQTGVYFTLPGEKVYLYDRYEEQYLSRLRETITLCEKAAEGSGLQILIENTGGYTMDFQKKALELFLESPRFGLTYDIGHDYGIGRLDQPFILAHQDKLRHFHVHDALGRKNHLELGTGEMDLPWYIDLAQKNNCRAVLEVKTLEALRRSADWLEKHQLRGGSL